MNPGESEDDRQVRERKEWAQADKKRNKTSTIVACVIMVLGIIILTPYPMIGACVIIGGVLSPLLFDM